MKYGENCHIPGKKAGIQLKILHQLGLFRQKSEQWRAMTANVLGDTASR